MAEVVYFDSCCLNRLEDNQSQPRIRAEAVAMEHILQWVAAGRVEWVASSPLREELSRNPDRRSRIDTLAQLGTATRFVEPSSAAHIQALQFAAWGLGGYDALHLATAADAGASWLLTVDDRFIRRAARLSDSALPEVLNPIDFLGRRSMWLVQAP